MRSVEESVRLMRSLDDVWRVVGDFNKDEQWRRVIQMRSDPTGPAQVGTRTHEVLRFLGRTYVTDATVTEVEPGRWLTYVGGGDRTRVRGYRRVEEMADKTLFVEGVEVELSGSMRLVEPLLSRLFASRMRSEMGVLKRLLERGT